MSEEVNSIAVIRRYQIILTTIWWMGFAVLLISLLYLSNREGLFSNNDSPIEWLFPHLVPIMGLTGAAAFFAKPGQSESADLATLQFLFRLAASASLFYLSLIAILIVLSSSPPSGVEVMDQLIRQNGTLGMVQGLVASTIGVFFIKQ